MFLRCFLPCHVFYSTFNFICRRAQPYIISSHLDDECLLKQWCLEVVFKTSKRWMSSAAIESPNWETICLCCGCVRLNSALNITVWLTSLSERVSFLTLCFQLFPSFDKEHTHSPCFVLLYLAPIETDRMREIRVWKPCVFASSARLPLIGIDSMDKKTKLPPALLSLSTEKNQEARLTQLIGPAAALHKRLGLRGQSESIS